MHAGALTQRLKEKEKFLIEAGELLVEAQKHYETQRNKATRDDRISSGLDRNSELPSPIRRPISWRPRFS